METLGAIALVRYILKPFNRFLVLQSELTTFVWRGYA